MRDSERLADAWFVTVQEALAGDYSLERELGRGGMGIVYLAREVALDRLVALKVLPPELAERAELRARFLAEARTAARLSHPNIVPIHRVGEARQVVFFAMAYIDGETLGARLRKRGALPGAEVTRIVKETAWALAYAHRQGVVHRDVKPENILLEAKTGRVVVADFGIAQVSEVHVDTNVNVVSQRTNADHHVTGTAQFMSPEQATGDVVDGRSDLYALGVMAYLCVAGRLPFDHENPAALLAQHLSAPVPAIARADVPVALMRVITRCLAKAPSDRFATGEALVDTLDASHAVTRQVAPALIKWAETRDPFVPLYLLWDAAFAISIARAVAFSTLGTRVLHIGTSRMWQEIGFVVLPWVGSFAFHLVRTWRMTRVGYGISDLRDAIRAVHEGERELNALDAQWTEKPAARVLRAASNVSFVAIGLTLFTPVLFQLMLQLKSPWIQAFINSTPQILMAAGSIIWAATAYGVPLPGRTLARKFRNWRDGMWLAPLGARIAGWLSKIAPRNDTRMPAIDRPTEVALELVAHRMFDALPAAMRESMPEFPRVLEQLATVATRARERQRALLSAQGQSVDSESLFSDALAKAEHELSEAVQAMERLRLGVMRLYAMSDNQQHHTLLQTELHDVTAQLKRLNSAEVQVQELLKPVSDANVVAARPVRRARRWWQFGASTPTPTH